MPTAKINRRKSLLFAAKKSSFLRFFFYETRANTQQVLPVQIGLYLYENEWCKKLTMETFTQVKET